MRWEIRWRSSSQTFARDARNEAEGWIVLSLLCRVASEASPFGLPDGRLCHFAPFCIVALLVYDSGDAGLAVPKEAA